MSPENRKIRAQQLKDDPLLQEALAMMERQALADFTSAHRWWWGDRRRRLAAERLGEVAQFRVRLDMLMRTSPPVSIPK